MSKKTPIVDSHIHLFPASHLQTLNWYSANHCLASQHSVDQYRQATSSISTSTSNKYLRGFIFLETDRISSLEESVSTVNPGWEHALDEVSFLARIALGEPLEGEGHQTIDQDLCLGIIPWAPVPSGPTVMRKYMAKVYLRAKTPHVQRKIRGVRYLVQDKPSGVILQPGFVASIRWLGEAGLSFDLGVDARCGGLHQLREAVQMMKMVYEKDSAVKIIINHLCKPNLQLSPNSIATHPEYLEWKELISGMARLSKNTYMKLSGVFSELPPGIVEDLDIFGLADSLRPWTDVVFDVFGADRIMFGSDWPVCNVGGGKDAWNRWRQIVELILERRGLNEEEMKGIWGQVSVRAYGLEVDMLQSTA
ncbi:hypothetical protein N7495_002812 [Penicillium taxi]|uniref:uncharacterized protein n=1 Tax=Penicillium taxi TaxID=168475 RepID=UPI00254580C6|nr:uncharacterized protein N7495_002812 [Penicillium taxi]KAJ5902284.1 hypothetical protein N7495_002812 [Penicillium taxi]